MRKGRGKSDKPAGVDDPSDSADDGDDIAVVSRDDIIAVILKRLTEIESWVEGNKKQIGGETVEKIKKEIDEIRDSAESGGDVENPKGIFAWFDRQVGG
jgi:hypothetical protein